MIETRGRELGGLDYAHLNAGIALGESDIAAIPDDDVERILDVNIDGVVLGARAVIPAMRDRGGGAIVATASLAGLIAFAPDPLYTLTKHAVSASCARSPNRCAPTASPSTPCARASPTRPSSPTRRAARCAVPASR